ncbi:heavy metal translocating P-type ATPase [Roseomonas sp. CAU 1739]|uniref:heavy metal translocating P-type ATPase n=1 Tax=Roseomonas sp. CAU 1739 TaxID=3140364 RepID=UPI00325AD7FF
MPDEAARRILLLGIAAAGLVAGLLPVLLGRGAAEWLFTIGTLPVLAALLRDLWHGFRRGEFGLDLIAALSMGGALLLGESLAAAVVALMYAGGEFLEFRARQRARAEMTALLSRVPRSAMRHGAKGLEEVPLDAIAPGDRLLIARGAVVPVDGSIDAVAAVLDTSALTGEPLPQRIAQGEAAMSGSVNAGEAFDLLATRRAAESTYAGIVRLVEAAQASKAPMARLADRWSVWFLAFTVLLAGGAWIATGDAVRGLAVLVVATPCPLILAVPVAIIAGLSRAAGAGVLVKSGGALEAMARARVLLLDKTGTLTIGRARLAAILPENGVAEEELLRLAASLDQASGHVLAQALVEAATTRGLTLSTPIAVQEAPGEGIAGLVDDRQVAIGSATYVATTIGGPTPAAPPDQPPGAALVFIGVDGAPGGVLVFEDPIRPDAPAMLAGMRRAGIGRVVLLSGDAEAPAQAVGRALGLDSVVAGCTPEGKVAVVRAEGQAGPVMMIGDGVNDAPALAAAAIGIAMGARGAAASSEAADAVVLVDRLDRLAQAIRIARRTLHIARQSVIAGIGLSSAGMVAAALGHLTPVEGALLQEAIDVAVILNALRALRGDDDRAI